MDANFEMLIKNNKADKLCGNNMVGIIKAVTLIKSNFEFFFKKKNLRIADEKNFRVREV